jgi:tetratricopeptide (TPR) repeat protein
MMLTTLLSPCLFAAQTPPPPRISSERELAPAGSTLDARILALQKAGSWEELADLFEGLDAKGRGLRLGIWLEALKKSARWARLGQVLDAVIPQYEAQGRKTLVERLLRAYAYEKEGQPAAALETYLKLGESGEFNGFVMASDLASRTGDREAFVRSAEGACARFPKAAEGWAWRGEAFFQAGKYTDAEPYFLTAVELNPRQTASWVNLSGCRNTRGAYLEAIEAADRALALDPKKLEARFNRALALFGLKRYPEGREDMVKALALNPTSLEYRNLIEENIRMADAFLARQGKKR